MKDVYITDKRNENRMEEDIREISNILIQGVDLNSLPQLCITRQKM